MRRKRRGRHASCCAFRGSGKQWQCKVVIGLFLQEGRVVYPDSKVAAERLRLAQEEIIVLVRCYLVVCKKRQAARFHVVPGVELTDWLVVVEDVDVVVPSWQIRVQLLGGEVEVLARI